MKNSDIEAKVQAFRRLLSIMDDLREKCPWDRKQTMDSLRNLTIEEVYELVDAIDEKQPDEIKEEIGDITLHMIFYAKIAEEEGAFDLADSLQAECEKLISRHPHIYGNVKVRDEHEVKKNWEKIKLQEGKKSVLSGVPGGLPALVKAYRMQEKTKQVGFEWPDADQAWSKVEEELNELKDVLSRDNVNQNKKEEEFGDVMFSLINFARYHQIDPETALARVNTKFKKRFEYIEARAPKALMEMSLAEMDVLWEEAKKLF